jgi:hypothetical protein
MNDARRAGHPEDERMTRRRRRSPSVLAALVVLLSVLASCGGGGHGGRDTQGGSAFEYEPDLSLTFPIPPPEPEPEEITGVTVVTESADFRATLAVTNALSEMENGVLAWPIGRTVQVRVAIENKRDYAQTLTLPSMGYFDVTAIDPVGWGPLWSLIGPSPSVPASVTYEANQVRFFSGAWNTPGLQSGVHQLSMSFHSDPLLPTATTLRLRME